MGIFFKVIILEVVFRGNYRDCWEEGGDCEYIGFEKKLMWEAHFRKFGNTEPRAALTSW